jgi:hypothetical protein
MFKGNADMMEAIKGEFLKKGNTYTRRYEHYSDFRAAHRAYRGWRPDRARPGQR